MSSRLSRLRINGLVAVPLGQRTSSLEKGGASRLLKAGVIAAAVAAAIVAAMPAAHAQDASTTAPASSAPASPSPSSSAPASGSQSGGGKASDPVCFQLTGHCVDSSKASGTKGGSGASKSGNTGKKPLNLAAPDVSTVVPEQDLKEPLPETDQITATQESQTVSVKGEQGVPPEVPLGLGAIWWAVSHPSQAWRILTPSE